MRSVPPERLTSKYWLASGDDNVLPVRIFRGILDETVEVHWHEFYELSLIVSGEGTHVLNGDALPLKRGSIFLLSPADFHEVIPDRERPIDMYNLIFLAQAIDERLCDTLFEESQTLMTALPERTLSSVEVEFDRVASELSERGPWYDFLVRGALQRILVTLARDGCRTFGTDVEPDEIHRALVYISHNFREPLTLEKVAAQAHLSPNYFSERFHDATGITFQNYLKKTRLGFARSLLSASKIPVSEVCLASGFNTLSHFGRSFKQEFERTPGSCREN